jgi:D-glycero-alpha-D-manno-heptose-7-phosphate kinase
MHEHWLKKREPSKGISNGRIDERYDLALSKGGASGEKLVGTGGSGFLMFQTPDRRRLRRTLLEQGLPEVDFSFDFDGSIVLLRNRG